MIQLEGITKSFGSLQVLKGNGCMYAQGYYYYKPMPIEEFAKLLENSAR